MGYGEPVPTKVGEVAWRDSTVSYSERGPRGLPSVRNLG